ncbi:MAG: hypothetical protein QOJ49_431, partial [Actinomycetota bacterium]|nr:hypothetical protein [Actinomycetota bacterium]
MLRVLSAAVTSAVACALFDAAPGAPAQGASTTCALQPVVRDITANQGLGAVPVLARGKQTLVRLYLSLPSCASRTAAIQLTGGSLTAYTGTTTIATVGVYSPKASSTPPQLLPYGSAPAVNAPADPEFVIAGQSLATSLTTARYALGLRASLQYGYRTSTSDAWHAASITVDRVSGALAAYTRSVEKRTNALRLLVVGMGRSGHPEDFDAAAQSTTQAGLATLSRVLPVPDGTGPLNGTTGGVRYSFAAGLLAFPTGSLTSTGLFCGNSTNFVAIKATLEQFRQTWNSANPTFPADRVVGSVKGSLSAGGDQGCAEGMAAVGGTDAWVRAIPDTNTSRSYTGALMVMELGHTMGAVVDSRDDPYSPHHSPNTEADLTSPERAYNTTQRAYLATDRTAMSLHTPWNDDDVVLERDDWSQLLCVLGGATSTECSTAGTVGTSTGVGGNPTFVLTGTTDGTAAGTRAIESYFSAGTARGEPDPGSLYRLVQVSGTVVLREDGVTVAFDESDHDAVGPQTAAAGAGVFSVAVPFDTGADAVELWKGTPYDPASTLLLRRARTAPPVIRSLVASLPGTTSGPTTRLLSQSAGAGQTGNQESSYPAISDDGRYIAFDSAASDLVANDTNGQRDIFVRDTQTGTTQRISVAAGGVQADGASILPDISGDGRYVVYVSGATNLTADSNGFAGVYLWDRASSTTQRIDVLPDGSAPGATSVAVRPRISSNGRYATFTSRENLTLATDYDVTGYDSDVFLRDLSVTPNVTELVDTPGATSTRTNVSAEYPGDISDDGSVVAFGSYDEVVPKLPGTPGFHQDIYVHDRTTNTTTRVSDASLTGAQGTLSADPSVIELSADGNLVAFASNAANLVGGDTNGAEDVFIRDRSTGATVRPVTAVGGSESPQGSYLGGATPDLSLLYVTSASANLVAGDTNAQADGFVVNRANTAATRVNVATDGTQDDGGTGPGFVGDIAAGGRFVAFASYGADLAPEAKVDGPVADVFVRDLVGSTASLPGQQTVTAVVDDDNPTDARLDVLAACDGASYPIAVGLEPTSVSGGTATFSSVVSVQGLCAGATLTVVVNDGYTAVAQDGASTNSLATDQHAPTAAVLAPQVAGSYLTFDTIPVAVTGRDTEDGTLAASSLTWQLSGPATRSGSGDADVAPPTGGWPAGSYALTVIATDSTGRTVETVRSFTVVDDVDHDGIRSTLEQASCLAATAMTDPASAGGDSDRDGLSDGDDQYTVDGICYAPLDQPRVFAG